MSDAGHVSEIELPGTGWWLQCRQDGSWRDVNDAQHRDEAAGVHVPADDGWAAWTADLQPQAHGGEWVGATTWWLTYGELPADGEVVTVVLDDGTHTCSAGSGRVSDAAYRLRRSVVRRAERRLPVIEGYRVVVRLRRTRSQSTVRAQSA